VLSYVTTSSCKPRTGVFVYCTVDLVASATDPDGDSVGPFIWSSKPTVPGNGHCYESYATPARVSCQLTSPEQTITATVTVADGRGLSASASLTVFGEGVNRPPEIHLALASLHLSAITPTMSLYGGVLDPDEGLICGYWLFRTVSVTGDCRPEPYVDMTCTSGVRIDMYRTAPAGMCHLTLEAQDSAGATTSRTVPIR
jgi:hypothetical protein